MTLQSLALYAGPKARAHIARHGLQAQDVRVVGGAAGGPKGLVLLNLDKFIFGEWLPQSTQPVDLVGASIGAWRMATACVPDCVAGFERLTRDYIAQKYDPEYNRRGKRLYPSASLVSHEFARALTAFYAGQEDALLSHPRYRLHVVTARGRGFLRQTSHTQRFEPRTVLGFLGAMGANLLHRRAMGAFMERVVFSSRGELPFDVNDYPTRHLKLVTENFHSALQASCSIPFVLNAINDIPHAPKGSYWDGGMTDYHLHMNFASQLKDNEIVLVPHFQQHLVPGWLDKSLKWRHKSTDFLDHVMVLAPTTRWVKQLSVGKIPDRNDFTTYAEDFEGRVRVWTEAVSQSQHLVDEFSAWLQAPCVSKLQYL